MPMGFENELSEQGKRELHQLSLLSFRESEFGGLTDEFVRTHAYEGMKKSTFGLDNLTIELGGDIEVRVELGWGKRELPDGITETKHIEITFNPSGTISVTGGILGTTLLLPETWRRDPEAKKTALRKAYEHYGIKITPPASSPQR